MGLFYLPNGFLPSAKELGDFLAEHDLACQGLQQRRWKDWCAQARAEIARQGLVEPRPYPSKDPPEGWERIDVDLSGLPRRKRGWTRLQAFEAVYEFQLNLQSRQLPSVKNYKAFADGKEDVPDIKVIQRYGGLGALLNEISYPGWQERAIEQERQEREQLAQATEAAQTEPPKQRRHTRSYSRDPEKRIQILIALRDRGPLASRDLVHTLEVSRVRVWKLTKELEERGLIAATEQDPRSPNQRYQLTDAAIDALNDEPTLRERLGQRVDGRTISAD